ncbi:MAG TPA: hypothetical protein VGB91_04340 [Rhizomicrobium sp.]
MRTGIRRPAFPSGSKAEEVRMLDILFVAIGLAFLAAAMAYVRACDRL